MKRRTTIEIGNELHLHLNGLCEDLHAERYEKNRPCPGCYQAVLDWENEREKPLHVVAFEDLLIWVKRRFR